MLAVGACGGDDDEDSNEGGGGGGGQTGVYDAPGGMEGGPGGAEIVAFGAPNTENRDTEMVKDFWAD